MCDMNKNENEMIYKVGDKVRIKLLKEFKKCEAYIDSMSIYADKTMTVDCVIDCYNYYKMKEDEGGWSFTPDMIECLVSSIPPVPSPFKPSDLQNKDIILHRDGLVGIVVDDIILYRNEFNYLKDYKESFDVKGLSSRDVMAVRRPSEPYECQFGAFEKELGELVYDRERDSVVEMTMEEICKALGKNVKIVKEK